MRALDAGESFVVTRNGIAVGELRPVRRNQFVSKSTVLAAFERAARVDPELLRRELDGLVDQDPNPRA
jgi:antitoxin (DNA-binding transcriptional repressor) of toxin-antitoxin stability system